MCICIYIYIKSQMFIFLFIKNFFFIFWLHCCTGAFSNCGEWGLLFVAACGVLIAVASLVAEHRL